MALDPKVKDIEIKDEIQKERRSFLKKTAYTVPSIVALGQLVRPTVAGASIINNDNQSAGNNQWGGGDDDVFGSQL